MPKIKNLKDGITKHILINAVEHDGKAAVGPVLGRVMAEYPELRKDVHGTRQLIEKEIKKINRLSPDTQKEMLEKFGYEKTEKKERCELKDLPSVGKKFVVRFAPNPDGALTLGNARPAILCDEYAKRYKGKFILRFDDTDPKVKVPEKRFYDWIREDLKWLDININKEIISSARLDIYYRYAEKLVKSGNAYVCTCDGERWKKMRDRGKPCRCRDLPAKEHVQRWKKMLSNEFKEGRAVLRIKTDVKHPNLAVRDFPAMRIVDKPRHPLVKAKLWPLYNFASAIDDHALGVTHILRGQEHSTNEVKQRYIYDYFGWKYPVVALLGRFSLMDTVLSKSKSRRGIAEKEFGGWDDPKLGTLRALRRRGFQAKAIRKLIIDIGLKPNDITITQENLAGYNKKIIDPIANRYFFVSEPFKIKIKNLDIKQKKIKLHPTIERGFRNFKLGKYFFIEKNDFKKFKGKEVRLKDLCNIKLGEVSELTGYELKNIPKIQWVPADEKTSVAVIMPDKTIKGYGEKSMEKLKVGDIIQMERFGFGRVDETGKEIVVVFAHK